MQKFTVHAGIAAPLPRANVNTDVPEARWAEFPFVKRPVSFYESLAARCGMSMQNKGSLFDLGYPKELPGHRNYMLEFQLAAG